MRGLECAAAAAVLVVLVTVAFFGLTAASTRILFTPAPRSLSAAAAGPADRGEPSAWKIGQCAPNHVACRPPEANAQVPVTR